MSRTASAPVNLKDGSIYHDTQYLQGAANRADAARKDAEWAAKGWHARVSYVIEDVAPFKATMRVGGYYRAGHSVYAKLEDTQGRSWPIFIPDLVALLQDADMHHGMLPEQTYEVCKKGTAYGIRLAK